MEEQRYRLERKRDKDRFGKERDSDYWEEAYSKWEPRGGRGEHGGDAEENGTEKKAPLFVRLIAWFSLIAVFIACGYGGTALLFKWMDSKSVRPSDLITSREDAQKFILSEDNQGEGKAVSLAEIEKTCTLFIPDGTEGFEARTVRVIGDFEEEEIQRTCAAYLDALKEGKWLEPSVHLLNVFRSGEWIYLNFNNTLLQSLKGLGREKSQIVLTGLVKTLSDNFKQIVKVKFYVDGQEVKEQNPVDLSRPWVLPQGP